MENEGSQTLCGFFCLNFQLIYLNKMTYSISDLERLTGVHSHTIRIWEQRYHALTPNRTEGNTRFYDDQQLKKLLNIVSLNQAGFKISKICNLSDQDMNQLLDQQYFKQSDNQWADFYVTSLIKYGLAFNEIKFNACLQEVIDQVHVAETYQQIIYPLLVRLGLMWRKDNICPAHEHFITDQIKLKLSAAIDRCRSVNKSAKTWLLFLPEDEDHDIGLMMAAYMLHMHGQNVIYLGSKVPLSSLKAVISTTNVDAVLFFMVSNRLEEAAQNYINQLSDICLSTRIHLAGNSLVIERLKNINHINCFKSFEEFESAIKNP